MVAVYFPGRRFDLRFPPLFFGSLHAARAAALKRLRESSGSEPIERFCDGYRAGEVYLIEALALPNSAAR